MAITFEEKNNFWKNILILTAVFAILTIFCFIIWKFLQESFSQNRTTINRDYIPSVNMSVLQDSDLADLNLFPEIKLLDSGSSKLNPFDENSKLKTAAEPSEIDAP